MQHAMKKTALMVALLAGSAAAQAEWSANVALTTDYIWRGVSQSDESPAIQGGIDYSHESGFYVGTWASNVDFDEITANPADMEWDLYAGFANEFSNGLGYDVGVIYYGYPDTDADLSWTEFYLNLSYAINDKMTLNGGVAHSSDALATSDNGTYWSAGLDFALPQDIGLSVSVGHYDLDSGTGLQDYNDWKLAGTKNFGGFDFELGYTDTSENQFTGSNGKQWDDGRLYLMVSKSL